MAGKRYEKLISTYIVGILMLGAALLPFGAEAENWTQTTDSDFEEGESFFVNIDGGTLKLTHTLIEEWTVEGEGSSDYLGLCVASAQGM